MRLPGFFRRRPTRGSAVVAPAPRDPDHAWNYLQIESVGRMLHATAGPGRLTRDEASRRLRALLALHTENLGYETGLVAAWDAGAADDTVYAGSFVWCIYVADDPDRGARAWVDDLVAGLEGSRPVTRVVW